MLSFGVIAAFSSNKMVFFLFEDVFLLTWLLLSGRVCSSASFVSRQHKQMTIVCRNPAKMQFDSQCRRFLTPVSE